MVPAGCLLLVIYRVLAQSWRSLCSADLGGLHNFSTSHSSCGYESWHTRTPELKTDTGRIHRILPKLQTASELQV
ncbi:hypothetical protein F5Y18DRAFT_387591 [Xylariaceae sp. FL1019]|nr:hypothetical protein F5Y18DRAFT_387591 [Xylariaceae sp. FL1019]